MYVFMNESPWMEHRYAPQLKSSSVSKFRRNASHFADVVGAKLRSRLTCEASALIERRCWSGKELGVLLHPCNAGVLPGIVQNRTTDIPLLIRHEEDRLAGIVHNEVSVAFRVELKRRT